MKNETTQRILLVMLMLAVLAYTVFNYVNGKIDFLYFAVLAAFLLYPLIANVIRLIQDLRK